MTSARSWLRWVVVELLAVGISVGAVLSGYERVGPALLTGLIACAALLVRHRFPRSAFVLCLPALSGGLGWPPSIVALFRLGRQDPGFRWLSGAFLATAVFALTPVLVRESLSLPKLGLTLIFVGFTAGTPLALGVLVNTRQQLTASLRKLREATEAESFAKAERARAEERARITREIHDAVGHQVTLIAVEAAALSASSGEAETRTSAARLRGLAKEALGEMRTTLGLSGPDAVHPTNVTAVRDLVRRARESGLDVRLHEDLDCPDDVPGGVSRAAYRLVQEALTNASKYAPDTAVEVRLTERDSALRVVVSNGAPPGPPVPLGGGGSGLEGLRERVDTVGGTLEARTLDDGGFELVAVLPMEQP